VLGSLAPLSLSSMFSVTGQPALTTATSFASPTGGGQFPYEVAGVSVTINGKAMPLVYVSPGRVNFQVSNEIAAGAAEVVVTSQDGYVSRSIVTIAGGLFRMMTDNGIAVAQDGAKETGSVFDLTTSENFGADKRTRLRLYATGISGTAANSNTSNDILINGLTQPNLAESVTVEARLEDGRTFNLPVEFAGVAGTLPGLDQVSVVLIPQMRGAGTVALTMIINGQRSNSGTVSVR